MTGPDERELLGIARQAAQAAAEELRPRFGEVAEDVRSKSTPTDLASEADVAAESAIRQVLEQRRPQDAILAEESGATGQGELRWLVDPLDGTVNFLFGIPAFVVSVACEAASGTLAAVVLDPVRDECFEATHSGRATLNGSPIEGSKRDDLATSMVATGFGYDAEVRARQAEVVSRVLPRARDIRRFGAAALDLAWCACGRWDAYYERGIHPWDVAAGKLICSRAGLEICDLPPVGDEAAGLIVAPGTIMQELFQLVVG